MGKLTPPLNTIPTDEDLLSHKKAQTLAFQCAQETADAIRPGWSEKKTATFIRQWLADRGVTQYFHRPLVFFAERTRYDSFTRLRDLAPTSKMLKENDVFILDFGPIVEGVACDISITRQMGTVTKFDDAFALLTEIRKSLPRMVEKHGTGSCDEAQVGLKVLNEVNDMITRHGFDPIHQTSNYSFFGHRLNGTKNFPLAQAIAARGKQTYGEFFARGLSGQLWSGIRTDTTNGLWAVEPHIGTEHFGVKFEEMLLVSPDFVGWVQDLP